MRNDEHLLSDEMNDQTIRQLLAHLKQLRQAVPVNYQLKAELKKRLLEQMKQMETTRATAEKQKPLAKKWWWGSVFVLLAALVVLAVWPHDELRLTDYREIVKSEPLRAGQVALSPAGNEIALVTDEAKLYTYKLDGEEKPRVATLPATMGTYGFVSWANDSRRIAAVEQTSQHSRIWIIDLDQNGETAGSRLVWEQTGGQIQQTSWSPDDRHIAYSTRTSETAEIWITSPLSLASNRLTEGDSPAWSPDGSSIAFVKDGAVHVIDLPSGRIRKVAEGTSPSWVDEGRLTFVSSAGELVEVNWDQQSVHVRPVVISFIRGEKVSQASWTTDGKRLLLATHSGRGTRFYVAE